MAEHPIQGLMKTAMENIKEMVDVNTIIGDPIEAPDGKSVIIPVSKVGFGFAAGGSEFSTNGGSRRSSSDEQEGNGEAKQEHPFGGGSGGGVSITPVAFIVVNEQGMRLMSTDSPSHLYERIIDFAPQIFERLQGRKHAKEHKSNTDPCC
ncbi:sporulation protein YtfJ [Seinonella peptonophila]|uniref:Sporulation protein YtfJ n=1 Tax=Seinonella peptonophila TaxID=112248 RepID=A0A1M4TJ64_9BACL|nr:GerW family sporulation protein [Seinonella peptonophila]SHE44458.1 sporulation protein YtfJ [Seinonella peptonophila]